MRFSLVKLAATVVLVALWLWGGALPVCAQSLGASVLTVSKGPSPPGPTGPTNYADLQSAVDAAIILSGSVGHVTIIVFPDTYTLPISAPTVTIPADADITIRGLRVPQPFTSIITGQTGFPTIKIDGSVATSSADRLVIEGMTIAHTATTLGPGTGIEISGAAPSGIVFQPTISRCYIRKNGHGIQVTGNAKPIIVNCSIVENDLDGVNVAAGAATAKTDMLHDTFVLNKGHGVFVTTGSKARVRNSVVYRNGEGPALTNGGLCWETDPFLSLIVPSFGELKGGTLVTIKGLNLFPSIAQARTTRVFFGPPPDPLPAGSATNEWTYAAVPPANDPTDDGAGNQTLSGFTPASWLDAPGPVDVYIIRGDQFSYIVPMGFTYVGQDTVVLNGNDRPYVTELAPDHGPPEGGNWVFIYGSHFDVDCDVAFDYYTPPPPTPPLPGGDKVIQDAFELSPRVIWLGSGKLLAKVPPRQNWAKPDLTTDPGYTELVQVIVRNNKIPNTFSPPASTPGLPNETDTVFDYEYRNKDRLLDAGGGTRLIQPLIVQIVPNYARQTQGASGDLGTKSNILGWGFDPHCVVRIGGIQCSYLKVNKNVSGGVAGPNGETFDEIQDVVVPIAQFGTGGTYDVEVTNPSGLYDVMAKGFTYYADGVPNLEPTLASQFMWRPANFQKLVTGDTPPHGANTKQYRLLGDGFDMGIQVLYGSPPVAGMANMLLIGNPPSYVRPHDVRKQHAQHDQRTIWFNMSADPNQVSNIDSSEFFNNTSVLPAGTYNIPVTIRNVVRADGQPSAATDDLLKTSETTNFCWAIDQAPGPVGANQALYFEITKVVKAAPSGTGVPRATATIKNWLGVGNMDIYVDKIKVNTANPPPAASQDVTFEVPTLTSPPPYTLPAGMAGLVDVTAVLLATSSSTYNHTGVDLYSVVERALLLDPPADLTTVWRLYGRAIEPRTIPATGNIPVRILGSNFKKGSGGPTNGDWDYTVVRFRWQAAGVDNYYPPLGTTAPPWQPGIAADVRSFNELWITAPPADATTLIPINTPVDVVLQNINGTDTNTPPALTDEDVMTGAVVFFNDPLVKKPDVTDAHLHIPIAPEPPLDPAYPGILPAEYPNIHWGTVKGGTKLDIVGTNFLPGGAPPAGLLPRVLIGGIEARILTVPTNTGIVIETPPAPQGLPGTYEIAVQTRQKVGVTNWTLEARAPRDKWFTYIMDGTPVIRRITPNHDIRTRTTTDPVYATIYGSNFDDVVEVDFFIDANDNGIFETSERGRSGDLFYSVSPFEIVVEVPESGTLPLQNTDFGNGSVSQKVKLVVKNTVRQGGHGGSTADPSLISNAIPFYYYMSPTTPLVPAVPEVAFNDVYLNYRDYINVKPDTGSVSVDPMLDPGPPSSPGPYFLPTTNLAWWLGKLGLTSLASASSMYTNPVQDKAGRFSAGVYSQQDFETDQRPASSSLDDVQGTGSYSNAVALPDIGADEVAARRESGQASWYFALVSPDPVPAMEKGKLLVQIGIDGVSVANWMTDDSLFIVPQGGDPGVIGDRILLTKTHSFMYGNGGYFFYTNRNPITTRVRDAATPAGISEGDILADGHAALFLIVYDGTINGSYIGFNYNDLTDGGRISDQAVYGRHFLIDTVPPRAYVESYYRTGPPLTEYATAADFLGITQTSPTTWDGGTSNDAYNAQGVAVNAVHPIVPNQYVYAAPRWTSTVAPGAFVPWSPYAAPVPVDYLGGVGLLLPPNTQYPAGIKDRTQAFFNVGSKANGLAVQPLSCSVQVKFIDPPVTDEATGVEINNQIPQNRDHWIVSSNAPEIYTRQRAGFVAGPVESLNTGSARWQMIDGATLLTGVTLNGQFLAQAHAAAPVGPPAAQPYSDNYGHGVFGPGSHQPYPEDELAASWTFPNIPWNLADTNFFHVSTQFVAKDRAGNETPTANWLAPLHLWWLLDTRAALSPNREGTVTSQPSFEWKIKRNDDPVVPQNGGPKPVFSFTVWRSAYPNQDYPDAIYGPYENVPIPGAGGVPMTVASGIAAVGSPWSTALMATPDMFTDLNAKTGGALDNRWVMFVVLSADEAGNVEPWPDSLNQLPYVPGDPAYSTPYPQWGQNWQRFFYSTRALPNTTVTAKFWHNGPVVTKLGDGTDVDLGALSVVPLPDSVTAANIRLDGQFFIQVDVPTGVTRPVWVQLWLLKDGKIISLYDANDPAKTDLGQNPPQDPVAPVQVDLSEIGYGEGAYVLWARAYYVDAGKTYYDPTPASVTFVVSKPGAQGEAAFVNPRNTEDKQPIKLQEEK